MYLTFAKQTSAGFDHISCYTRSCSNIHLYTFVSYQFKKTASVEPIRPHLQSATEQAASFLAINGAHAKPKGYLQASSLMPTHQRHQAQQQSSASELAVEHSQ